MSDRKNYKIAKSSMEILVGLYPRPFRDRFGNEIVQTFSDMIDAVKRDRRSIAPVIVMALCDAAVGLAAEWIRLLFTTVHRAELTTRVAALLIVPFFALVAISIFGDFFFSAKIVSILTVDGQQLNGLGRIFVFGSVVLLLGSSVINLAGSVSSRRTDTTLAFAPSALSIGLGAVQAVTIVTIAVWMFAESAGCLSGVCD